MVTSEIREQFNVRFVKLLIIDASEIIPEFQEYTIWLPINIMGEELSPQSWIFDTFILVLTHRSRTPRSLMFNA